MYNAKRQLLYRLCRRSFGAAELGRGARDITRAEKTEAGLPVIRGMSAQFNVWYGVRDWFGEFQERIDPKAFDKTLAENPDIVCCFNHDPNYPLGAARGGTLDSFTDKAGLHYEARVDLKSPNTLTAYTSVERGDTQGASIAFRVVRDLWEFDRDAETEKVTILEARLFEHGPVLNPASPTTTAEVEEHSEDAPEMIRSVEIKLRRGVELTPTDVSILNRNIGQITERLRGAEPLPSNEQHEAADTRGAVEALRSRLGLLEKSVTFHLEA